MKQSKSYRRLGPSSAMIRTESESEVYLALLETEPSERGRGHGRALMETLCAEWDRDRITCWLICDPAKGEEWRRDSLLRFYRSLGFVSEEEDEFFMTRRPAASPSSRS